MLLLMEDGTWRKHLLGCEREEGSPNLLCHTGGGDGCCFLWKMGRGRTSCWGCEREERSPGMVLAWMAPRDLYTPALHPWLDPRITRQDKPSVSQTCIHLAIISSLSSDVKPNSSIRWRNVYLHACTVVHCTLLGRVRTSGMIFFSFFQRENKR